MNKIGLIIEREFLNRVHKKSFLVATILIPLIFPTIIALLVFFLVATILIPLIFPTIIALLVFISKASEKNASKEVIYYIDESRIFVPDTSKYIFRNFSGSLEDAKKAFTASDDFGLLYIPPFELSKPEGITLYTRIHPSLDDISVIENLFEGEIKDLKMQKLRIDQKILDSLKTKVNINTVKISEGGQEKSSNSGVLFGIGMAGGILMYMFIFIYGAQIMQGIIEEKTSKVVEVIVSSVKPFQLMMGKIIGLASKRQ